jgi:Family of unknown function (DUF6000)
VPIGARSARPGIRQYVRVDDATLSRLVTPYYGKMMRTNAVWEGARYPGNLVDDLTRVGRTATSHEVIALLRSAWRERVMGAWLAVMQDDLAVTQAVLQALETSYGSLDSPPLACVAVTLAGSDALPSIERYTRNDLENRWGGADLALAAAEHLMPGYGEAHRFSQPNAEAIETMTRLLGLAATLRQANP